MDRRLQDVSVPSEIVIPLRKSRIGLFLLVGLAFVGCGIGIWLKSNSLFEKGIVILPIAFFGFGVVVLLRKLLDPNPGLIIDADGLIDNTTIAPPCRIYWADIISFHRSTSKFLTFSVKENTARRRGFLIERLTRWGNGLGFEGFSISCDMLRIDDDDLASIVEAELVRHRRSDDSIQASP